MKLVENLQIGFAAIVTVLVFGGMGYLVAVADNVSANYNKEYRVPYVINDTNINELISKVNNLKEGERLVLNVNSLGGSAGPLYELVNAMHKTKGHVIAHVTGYAESAGGLIALSSSELVVEPLTIFMFHGVQNSTGAVLGADGLINNSLICEYILKGILTSDELNTIFTNHSELYLTGEEVKARFDKLHGITVLDGGQLVDGLDRK